MLYLVAEMAFRTLDGKFLSSSKDGTVVASTESIRDCRHFKIFKLTEVLVPVSANFLWPLRCSLGTKDGRFVSNASGILSADACVACCSETFLIDIPTSSKLKKGSVWIEDTVLWTGDARHVISGAVGANCVVARDQHSCAGHDEWSLRLLPNNSVQLHRLEDIKSQTSKIFRLSCAGNIIKYSDSGAATSLKIEMRDDAPSFLVGAHGGLVCSRPSATPLHGRVTSSLECCDQRYTRVDDVGWIIRHHGDDIYSIVDATSGHQLYVTSAGDLRLCLPEDMVDPFPHAGTIFKLNFAWTCPSGRLFSDIAENQVLQGFVAPQREAVFLGFTITSVIKIDGRRLRLTTLPGNRLTTIFENSRLTRWDLFSIVDKQAVLKSSMQHYGLQPRLLDPNNTCQANRDFDFAGEHWRSYTTRLTHDRPLNFGQLILWQSSDPLCCTQSHQSITKDLSPDAKLEKCDAADGNHSSDGNGHVFNAKTKKDTFKRLAEARMSMGQHRGWPIRSAATLKDFCCDVVVMNVLGRLQRDNGSFNDVMQSICRVLPEEILDEVMRKVFLLSSEPKSTKLSLQSLLENKDEYMSEGWIDGKIPANLSNFIQDTKDTYLCSGCQGASSILTPMDAALNPQHYRFLLEMERMRFGGTRRRRDQVPSDGIITGLKFVKHAMIFAGLVKCLSALAA